METAYTVRVAIIQKIAKIINSTGLTTSDQVAMTKDLAAAYRDLEAR